MKNFLLFLLLLPISAFAQPDFNSIADAVRKGNVQTLSTYFDQIVEVTVLAQDDMLDKAEAVKPIADFFNKNKPAAFNIVHKGTSADKSSHYAIGTLTSGGKNYRVYIFLKQAKGQYLIQELRIENE